MSQILAMATRLHSDLVPITSDLTAYSLHCSDTDPSRASQAYVLGKLLPQDLCTCCSSAGNALPQLFSWLTLSPPSSLCSDISSSVRAGLISFLKNFNSPSTPPNHTYSTLFFPRVFIIFWQALSFTHNIFKKTFSLPLFSH